MVKKLFILLFVLCCSTADAAFWIKHDSGLNPRCVINDGVKAGAVASYNTYDTPLNGWVRSNIAECEDAKGVNKKLDLGIVTGSRIVDMTQAEVDAIAQAQVAAQVVSETSRLNALDNKIADLAISGTKLTKVENAIDNIGNLADAKRFLKRLVRYIAATH